ncbi:MAG TPA: RNA polymerase sigma factor [Gemmatimonadales bacterium]|nr:RNA polymerase sigma factor [Gemmatimonadales bacterium]
MRPGSQAADGEIVRAVLAGDRERYARLVERYRDRYARYAARMLGSADAAEDALQDAFVRAYDQLAQCKDPDNFIGWFFLILRNRCFAERRRNRTSASLDAANEVAAADRTDGGAESAERRRALQLALMELTPDQREVFVLKHMEGLSYTEIAERLSTSVPSLKMRMHRAYDKLREQLRDHT